MVAILHMPSTMVPAQPTSPVVTKLTRSTPKLRSAERVLRDRGVILSSTPIRPAHRSSTKEKSKINQLRPAADCSAPSAHMLFSRQCDEASSSSPATHCIITTSLQRSGLSDAEPVISGCSTSPASCSWPASAAAPSRTAAGLHASRSVASRCVVITFPSATHRVRGSRQPITAGDGRRARARPTAGLDLAPQRLVVLSSRRSRAGQPLVDASGALDLWMTNPAGPASSTLPHRVLHERRARGRPRPRLNCSPVEAPNSFWSLRQVGVAPRRPGRAARSHQPGHALRTRAEPARGSGCSVHLKRVSRSTIGTTITAARRALAEQPRRALAHGARRRTAC